nr:TetR/AcrR family transcriptional regulator C-terminal domain-containing protein [Dyella mobilis]
MKIAAALRRQIVGGDLRGGDRLPSTRQLARQWKVALATATKALAVLRHEGLIEARARSATTVAVIAKPPSRRQVHEAPASQQHLSQRKIVGAAIEIADKEGLAALSMRSVAARLGVATMSTYRFVKSKESLVLMMADAAYGELPPSQKSDGDWRTQIDAEARTLWTLYRKHPWLTHINSLTRPLLLPNLMAHAEAVLAALDRCGLTQAISLHLHVLLYSYVHGVAIHIEREAHAEATTGLSEEAWMETQSVPLSRLMASGAYPTFTALITSFGDGYDLRLDDFFEFGLTTLLDGFAVTIERSKQR